MKKLLLLSLLALSAIVFVPSVEAKTNAAATSALAATSAEPQISVQIGRGNRRINRPTIVAKFAHIRATCAADAPFTAKHTAWFTD